MTLRTDHSLLHHLAVMPFLDRMELAAVSQWSTSGTYKAMRRLEDAGLAFSVRHNAPDLLPTQRYSLTPLGIHALAEEEGAHPDTLLRRYPVSGPWQHYLLGRLDTAATFYRLAAQAASALGQVSMRWRRSVLMDALLTLPNEHGVAMLRQGPTMGRTPFAKRLWRLWHTCQCNGIFLTVPDAVQLRQLRPKLAASPTITYAAIESHVLTADADAAIWWLPSTDEPLSTTDALRHTNPGPSTWPRDQSVQPVMPQQSPLGNRGKPTPIHALPVVLNTAEKRALDVLFDWPWVTVHHLGAIMGVKRRRIFELVRRLEEQALVERVFVKRDRYLTLSDRALRYLAQRDRSFVPMVLKRWSPARIDPPYPRNWNNIHGSSSRQLLRHLDHTEAVHNFLAALANDVREEGWRLEQLDPPTRASRFFNYDGRLHSIHPDAFGKLVRATDNAQWCFFLELERRAIRPVTLLSRLSPYLRYFSTRDPSEHHGIQPVVLTVFENELAADHFLKIAAQQSVAKGQMELYVSSINLLDTRGLLGHAWRQPNDPSFIKLLPDTPPTWESSRPRGRVWGGGGHPRPPYHA